MYVWYIHIIIIIIIIIYKAETPSTGKLAIFGRNSLWLNALVVVRVLVKYWLVLVKTA